MSSVFHFNLTTHFFVRAAWDGLEAHWRKLAHLAVHSRGLVVDLNSVPSYAVEWIVDEHNKFVESHNSKDK
jgi:hypothetical protein